MVDLLIYLFAGLITAVITTPVLGKTGRHVLVDLFLGAFGAYTANLVIGTIGLATFGLMGTVIFGILGAFVLMLILKVVAPAKDVK